MNLQIVIRYVEEVGTGLLGSFEIGEDLAVFGTKTYRRRWIKGRDRLPLGSSTRNSDQRSSVCLRRRRAPPGFAEL